jgi:hypothetical protein
MSTVARRTFASTPHRDATSTWNAIVDTLASKATPARQALLGVSGVAASLIADKAPEAAPIVVTCDGPRTRIYCVYDEDALDASQANEAPLGYDALNGNWAVSLPCEEEDLSWVSEALKKIDSRITARDKTQAMTEQETSEAFDFTIDAKEFAS